VLHKFLGLISLIVGGILALLASWLLVMTISVWRIYNNLTLNLDPRYFGLAIVIGLLFMGIFLLIAGFKIIRGNRSLLMAGLSMFFLFITFALTSAFIFITTLAGEMVRKCFENGC
jgi:hypothetical protein